MKMNSVEKLKTLEMEEKQRWLQILKTTPKPKKLKKTEFEMICSSLITPTENTDERIFFFADSIIPSKPCIYFVEQNGFFTYSGEEESPTPPLKPQQWIQCVKHNSRRYSYFLLPDAPDIQNKLPVLPITHSVKPISKYTCRALQEMLQRLNVNLDSKWKKQELYNMIQQKLT